MPQRWLGKRTKALPQRIVTIDFEHLLMAASAPFQVNTRDRRNHFCALCVCLLMILLAQTSLRSSPAEDKKLSVYIAQKTYTLAVIDIDKTEYVGLSEFLEPLGKLQVKVNGSTFRVRLGNIEGEFSEG